MASEDLEIGVSATGIDGAVAGVGRVKSAIDEVTASTEARRAQARQQVAEETQWANAIAQARERQARQEQAAVERARRAEEQATQRATAAQQAHVQQQTLATTQTVAFTQRVGAAAGAVQSLSDRLGGQGTTFGLVASLAASAAAGAQLGATFGPAGAVVGGILGAAIPAIEQLIGQTDDLERANRAVIESYDDVLGRLRDMQRATSQSTTLSLGLGSVTEQTAARDAASQRLAAVDSVLQPLARRLETGIGLLPAEYEELTQRVEAIRAGREQLAGELSALEEALRQSQSDADADTAELMDSLGVAAKDGQVGFDRGQRGGSRGGQRRQRSQQLLGIDAGTIFREDDLSFDEDPTGLSGLGDEGLADFLTEQSRAGEEARERMLELADATREAQEAQYELSLAAQDATKEFTTGWVDSIDEVVAAWREANGALRAAGGSMISTSRLLDRSMVAVGNNIADTIGGTLKGAFEQALGAWLDGSVSFVEAAEQMAKGVVKALVVEGIVQAVVETARGIADLAGYRYDTAALHFASAAAWGAVAGVAGAVGAGIGAFGGAGDKGAAKGDDGGARAMSDRSVREERDVGPTIINVYPGILAPSQEVARNVANAIRDAERIGCLRTAGALPRAA